ncbi:IucA/IucC family protein [Arthrobacter sp. USHLN218]|uniref:IucA/IucC family protein n=1 Tax=Arthrobacter sp. USHLN218 TaxID=3081232 RepID=UPI00301B6A9C
MTAAALPRAAAPGTAASGAAAPERSSTPEPAHLQPDAWVAANRLLVRKAIAEFSHERLLRPEPLGGGAYRLASDDGASVYHFAADRLELDHWSIPAASIHRVRQGTELAPDALDFILEFRHALGIGEEMLPVYLEEISSTLAGHAYKLTARDPGAPRLAAGSSAGQDPASDFQEIERSMSEGHPCFVANNGRLGFGLTDYLAYAPEAGQPVRLVWIAVHRGNAAFSALPGLGIREHLAAELGSDTLAAFEAELGARGLAPEDYLMMPVHPWQWENKLAVTFAAEIAQSRIVLLGEAADSYQAQQSIRTFFNRSAPHKCYVKTALSVLNMGFMRGLSAEYMAATPAINQWLHELVSTDPTLRRHGFGVLREIAAIGYRNRYYDEGAPSGSGHRKMLAALWRESPLPQLNPGQQLATMASLLHLDSAGRPLVSEYIRRSGLPAAEWLQRYLEAYLVPLLHCFYRYQLVGMPHGENIILVLEDGVPVRAILKDIGEEVVLMADTVRLPDEAARIRVEVPEEDKLLSIFTDVFDCFFRFLAATLDGDGQLGEAAFWRTVAGTVADYQAGHQDLRPAFARYDLFAPQFALSCLNRLQLRNNQQMLDLADPSGSLQFAGNLANPLAKFRP